MYRITHSLISAWDYATGDFATEKSMDEFISSLKREPKPTSEAMQRGIDFENEVTYFSENGHLQKDEYSEAERKAITLFGTKVFGAASQVRVDKPLRVDGMDFLLVGIADYLKAGIIYDTKRVGMYEYGKYADSSQHPMYFELFPEASRFDYLIFDGYWAYTESYRRTDCEPIQNHIRRFIRDMRELDLLGTYKEYWEEKA